VKQEDKKEKEKGNGRGKDERGRGHNECDRDDESNHREEDEYEHKALHNAMRSRILMLKDLAKERKRVPSWNGYHNPEGKREWGQPSSERERDGKVRSEPREKRDVARLGAGQHRAGWRREWGAGRTKTR
jgi:hypothetical protein